MARRPLRHLPAHPLPAPPASGLDGVVARLAEDLADLAADPAQAIEELLGPVAAAALHREEPAAAHVAASADTGPLAAWVRAFVLGAAVPSRALAAAVPRVGVDGLERLGLLSTSGAATTTRCGPPSTYVRSGWTTRAVPPPGGSPPTGARA